MSSAPARADPRGCTHGAVSGRHLSHVRAPGRVHDRPGGTITLHPEAFLQHLRTTMRTTDGRATLRRRTTIEHTLARVAQIQGPKARYKGVRKNTLDVRRCATVVNLQRLARLRAAA